MSELRYTASTLPILYPRHSDVLFLEFAKGGTAAPRCPFGEAFNYPHLEVVLVSYRNVLCYRMNM